MENGLKMLNSKNLSSSSHDFLLPDLSREQLESSETDEHFTKRSHLSDIPPKLKFDLQFHGEEANS